VGSVIVVLVLLLVALVAGVVEWLGRPSEPDRTGWDR